MNLTRPIMYFDAPALVTDDVCPGLLKCTLGYLSFFDNSFERVKKKIVNRNVEFVFQTTYTSLTATCSSETKKWTIDGKQRDRLLMAYFWLGLWLLNMKATLMDMVWYCLLLLSDRKSSKLDTFLFLIFTITDGHIPSVFLSMNLSFRSSFSTSNQKFFYFLCFDVRFKSVSVPFNDTVILPVQELPHNSSLEIILLWKYFLDYKVFYVFVTLRFQNPTLVSYLESTRRLLTIFHPRGKGGLQLVKRSS